MLLAGTRLDIAAQEVMPSGWTQFQEQGLEKRKSCIEWW